MNLLILYIGLEDPIQTKPNPESNGSTLTLIFRSKNLEKLNNLVTSTATDNLD